MTHQLIQTEDGTSTYWNEEFQETYHSKVGAYKEALEKHVQACLIPDLATRQENIAILDICFGLSYNSMVAIAEARKANPQTKLDIIALENDFEIIKKIGTIAVPDEITELKKLFASIAAIEDPEMLFAYPCYHLDHANFSFDLIMGDATCSINMLEDNSFDAIFFDPFSPKVCPDLWHASFIKDVVSKAKPGAYISTYSSARVAKDGFAEAGCEVLEGPLCGRRTGGVLAKKL